MSSTNAGTVCLLIGQTLDSLSTIASSGGPQKGKGLTKISEVIDLVMDLSTFLSSVWWSWLLCLSPVENFNRGSALCLVVSQQGLKWLIKGHSTFSQVPHLTWAILPEGSTIKLRSLLENWDQVFSRSSVLNLFSNNLISNPKTSENLYLLNLENLSGPSVTVRTHRDL